MNWTDSERTEFLGAIDEETDRLTLMVSNLLDLSRIEGGVLKPDREWYDVPELIEDVAERLRARGAASHHRFRTEIEPDLPLIYLDYVEIAQVLMNLGENAIKYAGADSETILGAAKSGSEIEFFVRDSGPGIPVAEQRRIFDKFYRMQGDERVPGTGIGLSISKGIVEAHGGRIWLESTAGVGTTFRFRLPIAPDAGAAE